VQVLAGACDPFPQEFQEPAGLRHSIIAAQQTNSCAIGSVGVHCRERKAELYMRFMQPRSPRCGSQWGAGGGYAREVLRLNSPSKSQTRRVLVGHGTPETALSQPDRRERRCRQWRQPVIIQDEKSCQQANAYHSSRELRSR
jgi:hypothetical protein